MYRFTRARRLTNKKEFNRVFSQANKTVTSDFVILHCKSTEQSARIGFALSKKAVPQACHRNRLKRLLRESFRHSSLPAVDIVILARPGVTNSSNESICTKLGSAWEKLTKFYAS
ncbi:ribonuclease P protein component [Legionella quinlivanii]|uniref:ribonuclease P protein component n=1 Tax=Legionella quinlivanii TaxID=45073 RepID=UPI0007318B98|nr:ribonuclease P protein component [Legionella quinlivanii]MCW8452246.1 ribonuclease P protein component [Legionella quinlivanii]